MIKDRGIDWLLVTGKVNGEPVDVKIQLDPIDMPKVKNHHLTWCWRGAWVPYQVKSLWLIDMICKTGEGEKAFFIDGDITNYRRSNLAVYKDKYKSFERIMARGPMDVIQCEPTRNFPEKYVTVDAAVGDVVTGEGRFAWHWTTKGAARKVEGELLYLAREIKAVPPHLWVGFLDGHRDNCVRENLYVFEPGKGKQVREQILKARAVAAKPKVVVKETPDCLLTKNHKVPRERTGKWFMATRGGKCTRFYVDEEQFAELAKYQWQWDEKGAYRLLNGQKVYLQQFVTRESRLHRIRFVDGDLTNCCRSNLKVLQQNGAGS